MGRILAIDYGMKRTGLAVTDPLQLIATPLDVIESLALVSFLKKYTEDEPVDQFVLGLPKTLGNRDTDMTQPVLALVRTLTDAFPHTPIHLIDERMTTSIAKRTMIDGGMSKKNRKVKGNVDKISATIILQDFLSSRT